MPDPAQKVRDISLPPDFKSEAIRCIFAIIAFILVYFILFAMALVLALGSMLLGYKLVEYYPGFLTIIIGFGLVGLGVMVIIFLLKFLFERTREDVSDSIEITKHDQPELVDFIYSIAEEAGARKPKKIFLSHDVNACVFYNSGFWSMFLPVRKNLKIGMGLMNTLNISEFKAVIAHEFGHFSQSSMKLGSFVYNVNKVIFNMLYKNDGYSNTLTGFASGHAIFYVFAQITVGIVTEIQVILRQMYKLVNLSYMGLSRQMEFHADLVSATVSGSNNMISSLRRLEVGDACFDATLSTYDELWKQEKRAENIYNDHRSVLQFAAAINNWQTKDGLPILTDDILNTNHRVSVKDQWASHPTTIERKQFLDQYDLQREVNELDALTLIRDPEKLKIEITKNIYRQIDPSGEKTTLDNDSFKEFYKKKIEIKSLPSVFGDYYQGRSVSAFNIDECLKADCNYNSFEEIFSERAVNLPKQINSLSTDIALVQAIEKGEYQVNTFDFDGKKYNKDQAAEILGLLEAEKEQKEEELQLLDKQVFLFYHKKAKNTSHDNYLHEYRHYFKIKEEGEKHLQLLQNILELLASVFGGETLQNETIKSLFVTFKADHEPEFKRNLLKWMNYGAFNENQQLKEMIKDFTSNNYYYFSSDQYNDRELSNLNTLIHEGWNEINNYIFLQFKKIAEMQAALN